MLWLFNVSEYSIDRSSHGQRARKVSTIWKLPHVYARVADLYELCGYSVNLRLDEPTNEASPTESSHYAPCSACISVAINRGGVSLTVLSRLSARTVDLFSVLSMYFSAHDEY